MTTPQPPQSKLQGILNLINLALRGLALVPGPVGAVDAVALAFYGILQNALTLYQQETGQPFDATKIPLETPVS